jgi:hypothetical protein
MPEASAQSGLPSTSESQPLLIGVLGAAALALTCLLIAEPGLAAVPFALFGVAITCWSVRYVGAHPMWLICPLILIEFSTATWFLSGQSRAVFHYGLLALFCLPLLPAAWRNRTFLRGGFAL